MRHARTTAAGFAAIGIALFGSASAALAAETVKFVYDARGRLIEVRRTGSVNPNTTVIYTLDKAQNRLSKTTTT